MSATPAHRSISFQRNISYDIVRSSCIFDRENKTLASVGGAQGSRRLVVLDNNLSGLQPHIESYFDDHGICARIALVEPGEDNKSLKSATQLLDVLDDFPLQRRNEPIIAVGGGVLTDLTAFVAGIYRRGVPHIKIPTTLMGYVDAAIGIKCGFNYNNKKNRVGLFEPPLKVFLDPTFLQTLSERHILNGLGEIVKLAVILDANLFQALEKTGIECVVNKFQCDAGTEILDRSIDLMLSELTPNLYEDNLSRCVDFGHTFSMAYEMQEDGLFLHGEAVLIDIMLSVFLAKIRRLLSETDIARILNLIGRFQYSIPVPSISSVALWESLTERMLHRNGQQRLPLPFAIGKHCFVNDVTYREIVMANQMLEEWMYEKSYGTEKRRSRRTG